MYVHVYMYSYVYANQILLGNSYISLLDRFSYESKDSSICDVRRKLQLDVLKLPAVDGETPHQLVRNGGQLQAGQVAHCRKGGREEQLRLERPKMRFVQLLEAVPKIQT
jgi:hypothetical protein